MSFYHDIKEHISPSALDNWINSRSSFIKSYFQQEKTPETAAMKGGTRIHALIEGGMIKAKKTYEFSEQEIKLEVGPGTGKFMMGRPDSYSGKKAGDTAYFVDYKSGKANGWKEKLPTDVKMRATAWLVWTAAGCPKKVQGSIEYIQTTWDPETKQIIPIDGKETEVIEITYMGSELQAFTRVILKAMDEVNEFYEQWLKSTGEFVNEADVSRYAELTQEISEKEAELAELGDRIKDQMEFGGEENHKTPLGTFYFRVTDTYAIPDELPVTVGDKTYTMKEAEEVIVAMKSAKKNYELATEPVESKKKINFRPAKDK